MSDGLNQVRAMRVSEIMDDYRNIQTYIASIRANPSAEEYNEDGYVVLRACVSEAHVLLQQPFAPTTASNGDLEQDKQNLRCIIADAIIRRFRAQKICLRAAAAMRWIANRNQYLAGQKPHAGHASGLQVIRNAFLHELATITDEHVYGILHTADSNAGKWLAEDPSFSIIERVIEHEG